MTELRNCPFCGSPASVQATGGKFQIVGCSNINDSASSLLCPNPRIVVYKDDNGKWDYKWWNRRTMEGKCTGNR